MTHQQHGKPLRLASAAFHHALAGNNDTAGHYVDRISRECGDDGIHLALRGWIDAYVDHATDGTPVCKAPRMAFIQEADGQLDDERSDRVPAEIRWAGQLVAARASLDQQRFDELIDELPTSSAAVGDHVLAVLHVCARTIRGLPRGFAQTGGDR